MKKAGIILIIFTIIFTGCEDKFTHEYMANTPVYMSYDKLREGIKQTEAKTLENHGKIYFKDQYIFLIKELEGIHVIDNSDPVNPVNTTFIEIPGCIDMAIKDHVLYADSYIDMVSLDVSNIGNITLIDRITDVMPYTLPKWDENYPIGPIEQDSGVVIGWEVKMVTTNFDYHPYPVYAYNDYLEGGLRISADVANGGGVSGQGIGVGGSMARFGILEETLYAVDTDQLHIFDIGNVEDPVFKNSYYVGWNIETMFIYDEKAFFGTRNGMTIYNLVNPYAPVYISEFWHISSCDPVVVKDDLAYITLRGGNACGSNVNLLEVINLEDIENPELIASYNMTEPYGLGISENTLFVCDGNAGLKIYDVEDPLHIDDNYIAGFEDIHAYDVIPLGSILILVGENGIFQYDYSNISDIQLLSEIVIGE